MRYHSANACATLEEWMREVAIPAVGFAMTEAVLQRWLKQPGEVVDEGEPVAEIETDKTTAELEAPATGTLGRHRFGEGELVPVGVVLTVILAPGEIETDGAAGSVAPVATDELTLATATTSSSATNGLEAATRAVGTAPEVRGIGAAS